MNIEVVVFDIRNGRDVNVCLPLIMIKQDSFLGTVDAMLCFAHFIC